MANDVAGQARRRARVRSAIKAAAYGKPRLSVFRSSKQIYAQIIDDDKGATLVAASTIEKDLEGKLKTDADVEASKETGELVAVRAVRPVIKDLIFHRTSYIYYDRVHALAARAPAAGLNF